MILQCPSCNSRFLVADALIPAAGRTVRCGACKHEWFVRPAAPEGETAAATEAVAPVDFATLAEQAAANPDMPVPPAAQPRQLPVKQFPVAVWPFKVAAAAIAAAWIFVAYIAYFPVLQHKPGFSSVYHMFGVTDTSGLVFNALTLTRQQNDSRTQFVVAGSIANHAEADRQVPLVRVQLKDKKGTVMWAREYPVDHVMKPGEVYPFKITDVETSFANTVGTIVLDLGHPLELRMR